MHVSASLADNLRYCAGVPGMPGRPEAVDADKDFIKIRWQPPRSNGGSRITGYDVERREHMTGRWTKISRNPAPVRPGGRQDGHEVRSLKTDYDTDLSIKH